MRKLIYLIMPILFFAWGTAKSDLVVSNWDGYSPPDIMDTFAAATGFDGEMSFHATNEEIMGKVVASKWLQISSEGKNAKTKIAIIGNKTPAAISRAASDHILIAWGKAAPNVL